MCQSPYKSFGTASVRACVLYIDNYESYRDIDRQWPRLAFDNRARYRYEKFAIGRAIVDRTRAATHSSYGEIVALGARSMRRDFALFDLTVGLITRPYYSLGLESYGHSSRPRSEATSEPPLASQLLPRTPAELSRCALVSTVLFWLSGICARAFAIHSASTRYPRVVGQARSIVEFLRKPRT